MPTGLLGMLAALATLVSQESATQAIPTRTVAVRSPPFTSGPGIAEAQAWAAQRTGRVAFAVLDERGLLRGYHRTDAFPSASVAKAMLLVAVLRQEAPPSAAEKALLGPMITMSDNDAARAVFRQVGPEGLRGVARAAGMRRFVVRFSLFESQLTPADQARFFLQIDRLVPKARRAYARSLLGGVIPSQRWGIAPVAKAHRLHILFKGGWRPGLVHQSALLERGSQRVALSVMTGDQPSQAYGEATLAGIARRVLR